MRSFFSNRGFKRVFSNTGDPPAPPSGTPPKEEPKPKLFTQDEVNKIAAEERRKAQVKQDEFAKKMDELSLTTQQKAELEQKLEDIRVANLTKEEQAKERASTEKKKYEADLKKAREDAAVFQERFMTSTIRRELTDAAAAGDAYSAQQVLALLTPNSRLVEELDSENKPTGQYVTRVKFQTKEKETGKPLTLDLSPQEAIDKMKEDVPTFGNLFKSQKKAGVGGSGNPRGADGKINILGLPQSEINAMYLKDPRSLGLSGRQ